MGSAIKVCPHTHTHSTQKTKQNKKQEPITTMNILEFPHVLEAVSSTVLGA